MRMSGMHTFDSVNAEVGSILLYTAVCLQHDKLQQTLKVCQDLQLKSRYISSQGSKGRDRRSRPPPAKGAQTQVPPDLTLTLTSRLNRALTRHAHKGPKWEHLSIHLQGPFCLNMLDGLANTCPKSLLLLLYLLRPCHACQVGTHASGDHLQLSVFMFTGAAKGWERALTRSKPPVVHRGPGGLAVLCHVILNHGSPCRAVRACLGPRCVLPCHARALRSVVPAYLPAARAPYLLYSSKPLLSSL